MPIFKFQRLKSNRFITTPFIFRLAHKKGFTLVELLISVAIISILSTIGTASFQNYANRAGVKNSALELTSELRKYQNYAMSGEKNPVPGVTDSCAQPGNSLSNIYFIIRPASGSPSPFRLTIAASCTFPIYIKYNKVWPDPKIAQITKTGYILTNGDQGSCSYLIIWFYPMPYRNTALGCLGPVPSFGSGTLDRVFGELSKGTIRERVYITTGGLVYEQKP
jgi:prepilin-type N-terminal cleavage/methylation domain-containing protein